MKKNYVRLASLLLVTLLVGCGNNQTENPESTQSAVSSEQTQEQAQTQKTELEPLSRLNVEELVTLCDYLKIKVNVDAVKVDAEQVDYLMKNVYLQSVDGAIIGIKDRAVADGDTVIIDYIGKKDGVAFEGGTAEDADLTIGSGNFISGFEDGLIGVMPGETVDLTLTFPEDYYNTDLAGQEVVFTVTVKYILPDDIAEEDMLDEEVANMGLPNVSNVAEYRTFVENYLKEAAQADYDSEVQDQILSVLLDTCTFAELPEERITEYRDKIAANIEYNALLYNASADDYANYYFSMSSEEAASYFGLQSLKQDIVLQAIANAQGLNVDDEELESELEKYREQSGAATIEEFLGTNSKEEYRNYFMNLKVMDYLMENADITVNE